MDQMHEQVQHLHLVKRRIAMLSRGSRAGKSKNARSNDSADPQRGKRPRPQRFLEPMRRVFRVRNQLVNGLLGEELAGQKGLLKNERRK